MARVADQLLLDDGAVDVRWTWFVAASIAGAVAYRWKSAGVTMAVGMAAVWCLDAVA